MACRRRLMARSFLLDTHVVIDIGVTGGFEDPQGCSAFSRSRSSDDLPVISGTNSFASIKGYA